MKFKPGDRVVYRSRFYTNHGWNGSTGTVTGYRHGNVVVDWDKDSPIVRDFPKEEFYSHSEYNLLLTHSTYQYDPTQQGDKDEDI